MKKKTSHVYVDKQSKIKDKLEAMKKGLKLINEGFISLLSFWGSDHKSEIIKVAWAGTGNFSWLVGHIGKEFGLCGPFKKAYV